MLALLLAAATLSTPLKLGVWRVERITDPMTDEVTTAAVVKTEDAFLQISCGSKTPGTMSVILTDRTYFGALGPKVYREGAYRIGTGSPVSVRWGYYRNVAILGESDAPGFVSALKGASKITLQLSNYEDFQIVRQIPTTGMDQAMTETVQACF